LQPHNPVDFITKMCPVRYDSDAVCPLWDAALNRSFAGDTSLIRYMQKLFGMFLTGDISVQEFWVLYGHGNNGKNLLLDTLMDILGSYGYRAPESLLTVTKRDEHPTEYAALCGMRLVLGCETEDGARLRLQLIKRMTGDKAITGRYMQKDYFTFPRTHKMVLLTNNKPRVPENGEAAWRRIRLVPFNVIIPDSEIDPKLQEKLGKELSGILAWLVRGCLAWQEEGLKMTRAVEEATSEYRRSEDTIGAFINEFCDAGPGCVEYTRSVHMAYGNWCRECNSFCLSYRAFNDKLEQRKLQKTRDTKTNTDVWVGLQLKATAYSSGIATRTIGKPVPRGRVAND
jgi:putative DNA primase/helicase